jgi:hypothetical protein
MVQLCASAVYSVLMRKNKPAPKPQPRVADGISVRIRFASHKQLELIRAAALKRGIARDLFIQSLLQAAAELVLAEPPAPPLAQVARHATAMLQASPE